MKKKRIAIVPARAGSVRIKNKNIKNFHGSPLILNCLKQIKKTKLFDKIHVSTDSNKIKKIVKKENIRIDFLRPKKLAGDKISLNKILKFVLDQYKKQQIIFDEVWLIFATNPFLTKKIIEKSFKLYNQNKANYSIITVTKYNYPIEWAMKINNNLLKYVNPKLAQKDSKKTLDVYCDAGMLVIYQKNFLNRKKLNYKPIILPISNSVDIDNKEDFELAEKLFYANKKKNI